MQITDDIITIIAARAATLLGEWIGLSPLAKSNNGDQSSAGGFAMMLGAISAAKAPHPPADAVESMTKVIAAAIKDFATRRPDNVWMTYDVDYSPGREIRELSKACGIESAWPIKSCLNITIYRGQVSICDRRGYGDEGLNHYLVGDGAWLVTPCNIDSRLMPVVLAAVERSEVLPSVARIDRP